MFIKFTNLPVSDQNQALKFYTEVVGLSNAADIDMGPMRFLTVHADGGVEGPQIILAALDFPATATWQKAMFDGGMPILALNTDDVQADFQRLKAKGVVFRGEPQDLGPIVSVMFEDTCGNLVHLVQAKS